MIWASLQESKLKQYLEELKVDRRSSLEILALEIKSILLPLFASLAHDVLSILLFTTTFAYLYEYCL